MKNEKITTKATTTKTAKNNNFDNLLRTFENATRKANGDRNNSEYVTALTNLSNSIAYSVTNKLINVSDSKAVRDLKQGLSQDLNHIKNLNYAVNNATAYELNKDGDLVQVVKDKELNKAITDLVRYSLSDGMDLSQTASLEILKQVASLDNLKGKFMEKTLIVRALKKKVYIQDEDSVGGWEDKKTTIIQEGFKAVRRDISGSSSVQVANHKYTYFEDMATDEKSGAEERIYRRLPKYSGLATPTTDINGKITAYTADRYSIEELEIIVKKLNLTTKQAKILELRLHRGMGYKAIATYFGVTHNAIINSLKKIQAKCEKIGFTPKA